MHNFICICIATAICQWPTAVLVTPTVSAGAAKHSTSCQLHGVSIFWVWRHRAPCRSCYWKKIKLPMQARGRACIEGLIGGDARKHSLPTNYLVSATTVITATAKATAIAFITVPELESGPRYLPSTHRPIGRCRKSASVLNLHICSYCLWRLEMNAIRKNKN